MDSLATIDLRPQPILESGFLHVGSVLVQEASNEAKEALHGGGGGLYRELGHGVGVGSGGGARCGSSVGGAAAMATASGSLGVPRQCAHDVV